ncbi:hypothetical protein F4825DRAFT_413202 [Nemania diffusa]|nr:hypothetical protein F4825DRAFT_413202 [Nemania diffusa]
MFQLPLQIVVAIVQLLITTLQLFLMLFTWLNPKHAQPTTNQSLGATELAMRVQHTR